MVICVCEREGGGGGGGGGGGRDHPCTLFPPRKTAA